MMKAIMMPLDFNTLILLWLILAETTLSLTFGIVNSALKTNRDWSNASLKLKQSIYSPPNVQRQVLQNRPGMLNMMASNDLESARELLLSSDGPSGNGDFAGLDAAVSKLVTQNPVPDAGKSGLEMDKYKGVWKVCYAPHIATLSRLFMTQFSPIEYHLKPGNKFESYVRYSSSLFGEGWLNAAGSMGSVDSGTVKIIFDQFWWDIGAQLRRPYQRISSQMDEPVSLIDSIVQIVGTFGFIEPFSVFPMKYLDDDICVFEFPPLGVKITAARRHQYNNLKHE